MKIIIGKILSDSCSTQETTPKNEFSKKNRMGWKAQTGKHLSPMFTTKNYSFLILVDGCWQVKSLILSFDKEKEFGLIAKIFYRKKNLRKIFQRLHK